LPVKDGKIMVSISVQDLPYGLSWAISPDHLPHPVEVGIFIYFLWKTSFDVSCITYDILGNVSPIK
ncbi:MAG: hypothetical protein ABIL38_03275, partial [candidate division WOR-3 bacterium]